MNRIEGRTDPLATVANVSGIASFVLAVAGNNVEKLSLKISIPPPIRSEKQ